MRLMREPLPDLATTTSSPCDTEPEAMVPAKPRKSRFGRFTYCTGKRNGPSAATSSTTTVSRCSTSVGPEYQPMRSERRATLSP